MSEPEAPKGVTATMPDGEVLTATLTFLEFEDGQAECFTIARAILDAGWRPAADPDDPRPASGSPLDDEL